MIGKKGKQPHGDQGASRVEDGFPEMPRPMLEDEKPSHIKSSQGVEDGHEDYGNRMPHPFRKDDWPKQQIKPSFNNVPNGGYNQFEE
jgi:hypothetical protein